MSWFSRHRDSIVTFGRDWEYEDDNGNSGTIPLGTQVEVYIDLDVYRLKYEYSFLQDERIDFAAVIGLYVMPISLTAFILKSTSWRVREFSETFMLLCSPSGRQGLAETLG